MRDLQLVHNFQIGDAVTWLRFPKGGWGYCQPIPGKIVKLSVNRATVEVAKVDGTPVKRSVKIVNLRKRQTESEQSQAVKKAVGKFWEAYRAAKRDTDPTPDPPAP